MANGSKLSLEQTSKNVDPRTLQLAESDFELVTANGKVFLYRGKIVSWRDENKETKYLSIKYNGPVKLPPKWRIVATFIDKENFLDQHSRFRVKLPKKGKYSNQVNFTKLKLSKNLAISGTSSLHLTTISVQVGLCSSVERDILYSVLELERSVDMEIFSDHHQRQNIRAVDLMEYSVDDFVEDLMEDVMQDIPQAQQLELGNVLEPENWLDLNSSDLSDSSA